MHTPVYLFDECSNEFTHHHLVSKNLFKHYKRGKLHFLLLNTMKEVNFIFFLCLLNSFHCKKNFQNKGFHFYYCNYCSGCLNSISEENVQAHLNDCSQHPSKFICYECGMVSEISCNTCTSFIFNSKLILFSKTKCKLKKYLHKPSAVAVRTHLTIALFSNTLIPMDIQHSDIGCN